MENLEGGKLTDTLKLDVKKGSFKIYGELFLNNFDDNIILIVAGLDLKETEVLEIESTIIKLNFLRYYGNNNNKMFPFIQYQKINLYMFLKDMKFNFDINNNC